MHKTAETAFFVPFHLGGAPKIKKNARHPTEASIVLLLCVVHTETNIH